MEKTTINLPVKALLTASLLCLILIPNTKALAQYFPYEPAYNLAMFSVTKNVVERNIKKVYGIPDKSKPSAGNETTAKAASAKLNFTSSKEVHEKVLETLGRIAAKGDETKVKHHAEVLGKSSLLKDFDSLLRQYGFNSSNMADVFAAYTILSWQAITGTDAAKYKTGIEAFRQNMHSIMDNNEQLQKATNAEKQQLSETLSYLAMIFSFASQEQLKTKNEKALAVTREYIRRGVIRVSGIDLSQYELTNSGLRPKK
ncbi:DUF6683 family protein [Pseudobacter ginsenosidimutans]|nr:DUF6683 family protein [Pseudobacter ginsenosidimutans]QEC43094.1 hypothetical protein FSB84_15860 [Pseudobacter ginsenosidimutans]